jgi:outer membrane protein assembly factor BamB
MTGPRSRRDVLRVSGLALVAGVAGCLSGDSGSSTPTTTDSTPTTGTTDPTTTRPPLPEHAEWGVDLDGSVGFRPALEDGTLYVGREDGQLFALDPGAGDAAWDTDAGAGFFGGVSGLGETPTVVDDRLYVVPGAQSGVSGEGFRAVCLDPSNGDEQWSKDLENAAFLTLLGVHDGNVLVATSDDYLQNEGERLASLDPANGSVQWDAEVGDPRSWAVGAGGVVVEAYNGLRAVSLADGSPRFTKSAGVVDGVHVGDDTLVTGFEPDDRPDLAGLDPVSGEERWRGPDWAIRTYEPHDGVVYAGGERVGAFAASDGADRWTVEAEGNVTRPPTEGRLFIRLQDGIQVRDPATGEHRWEVSADLDSRIGAGGSLVAYVVGPNDASVPRELVGRDAASGDELFRTTFEDANHVSDPVVDGEPVYVATDDGRVYAFSP